METSNLMPLGSYRTCVVSKVRQEGDSKGALYGVYMSCITTSVIVDPLPHRTLFPLIRRHLYSPPQRQ